MGRRVGQVTRRLRNIPVEDDSAWVFNRMANDYDARPAYPEALIDEVTKGALASGPRLLDIGAGIGHLALPLAERGLDVLALEPARLMLERLQLEAARRDVKLRTLHGTAEALPFDGPSFDCAVIADALHFLDVERVAEGLRRVLIPGATLVVITCGLAPTPFMREVQKCIARSADRRRRDVSHALRRLASLANFRMSEERILHDETALDEASIERVLRTVSFVGPAMAGARFEALRAQIAEIPHARAWARTFAVRIGRRRPPVFDAASVGGRKYSV